MILIMLCYPTTSFTQSEIHVADRLAQEFKCRGYADPKLSPRILPTFHAVVRLSSRVDDPSCMRVAAHLLPDLLRRGGVSVSHKTLADAI